ncbi:MAG: hypothetical protein ACTFAK_00930 [Candidatus Electronema sp. VV]
MQLSPLLRAIFAVQPLHGLGKDAALPDEEKARAAKQWPAILMLTLVFSAAYYFLIFNKALIELELETDTRTIFKVYWPNQHGNYSEKNSAQLLIKPGHNSYQLRLANLSGAGRLRLDPSENKPANITIRRITLRQSGLPLDQLHSRENFADRLKAAAEVDALVLLPEGGVSMTVRGSDPQLELALPKSKRQISWLEELEHGLALLVLAVSCFLLARLLFRQLHFVPVLGTFALALILVMAVISAYNSHPDEKVHVAASLYYQDHSLPPRVGDPAIAHTYSAYGVSRLHSGEIYYLLAGKGLHFLNPFQLEPYLALRLLNVLLFCTLVLYAFSNPEFRYFFLPLLISPQIWYIFSYTDSEGLSVAVCLLAAWQLAAGRSALNRLLRDEPEKMSWLSPLLLGLLFSLLLLQKKNFYFLYIFFFLYFLWRIWLSPPVWSRRTLARFTAVILLGGTLFAAVKITDAWVNNFRKSELLLAAREQYAEPMYKPSTPLLQKHPYLQLRDRGKTLKQLLTIDRWGEKSFRTAFGVYGYTQYSAPFVYYDYVRSVGLLLLLALALSVACRGGLPALTLLGLAVGWTAFFLAGLIYHAWTADFQAQGRYLLPMVPMFAMLCYHYARIVIRPLFYSLFFFLFLLSVYNFIFVGLHDIGKTVI